MENPFMKVEPGPSNERTFKQELFAAVLIKKPKTLDSLLDTHQYQIFANILARYDLADDSVQAGILKEVKEQTFEKLREKYSDESEKPKEKPKQEEGKRGEQMVA